MHKEQQATGPDSRIETCRSNELDHIGLGLQFRRPDLGTDKNSIFTDFDVSISSGYAFHNSIFPDFSDSWNPLQLDHSLLHDSRTGQSFDGYPFIKRADCSNTWPIGYSDPGYGSQFGGDTRSSISVLSNLDSRTEISCAPDDCLSYINGVTRSRQLRTESIEENQLRCNICTWKGKTPSERRFSVLLQVPWYLL